MTRIPTRVHKCEKIKLNLFNKGLNCPELSKNPTPIDICTLFWANIASAFKRFFEDFAASLFSALVLEKEKRDEEQEIGQIPVKRLSKIGPKLMVGTEGVGFFDILDKYRPWLNS